MAKNKTATLKQLKLSHNIELLGYSLTRNMRKRYELYDFENSFGSKYKAYKDFKLLENEISKDSPTINTIKQKILLT